jgi:hypothetical protein
LELEKLVVKRDKELIDLMRRELGSDPVRELPQQVGAQTEAE